MLATAPVTSCKVLHRAHAVPGKLTDMLSRTLQWPRWTKTQTYGRFSLIWQ